ncbi:MAG: hypothetical protein R2854_31875 [Caldilineaceae bacterium]
MAWLRDRGLSALADAVGNRATLRCAGHTQAQPLWQGVLPAPVHGDLPGECGGRSGRLCAVGLGAFGSRSGSGDRPFLELHRQELTAEQQAQWLDTFGSGVDQLGLEARIDVYRRILAYRAVAFLLDGLRELAADAQELAAHAEDLPYFAATLTAAAAQAAVALETTDLPDAQIDALFARLT